MALWDKHQFDVKLSTLSSPGALVTLKSKKRSLSCFLTHQPWMWKLQLCRFRGSWWSWSVLGNWRYNTPGPTQFIHSIPAKTLQLHLHAAADLLWPHPLKLQSLTWSGGRSYQLMCFSMIAMRSSVCVYLTWNLWRIQMMLRVCL